MTKKTTKKTTKKITKRTEYTILWDTDVQMINIFTIKYAKTDILKSSKIWGLHPKISL
jgi:hypothetical protein